MAVEPHDVEDMISCWSMPIDLAVENQFLVREFRNRARQRRDRLRQTIAREQFDSGTFLVSEQPDAVELPFKDPFCALETLLRERGGHRLNPLGKGFRHGETIPARSRGLGIASADSHRNSDSHSKANLGLKLANAF